MILCDNINYFHSNRNRVLLNTALEINVYYFSFLFGEILWFFVKQIRNFAPLLPHAIRIVVIHAVLKNKLLFFCEASIHIPFGLWERHVLYIGLQEQSNILVDISAKIGIKIDWNTCATR